MLNEEVWLLVVVVVVLMLMLVLVQDLCVLERCVLWYVVFC